MPVTNRSQTGTGGAEARRGPERVAAGACRPGPAARRRGGGVSWLARCFLDEVQHAFGGFEVVHQGDQLFTAFGDDGVRNGEVIAVLAQTLGYAIGVQLGR